MQLFVDGEEVVSKTVYRNIKASQTYSYTL